MTTSIEKEINNYINKAIKGKQQYRECLQVAFEIFVANYNTKLNHNSTPLFNILKASGKDIQDFKEYIYKSTNITKLSLSDKGGLLLTFDGDFTYNDDYIDNHKWYEKSEKDDIKAIKELDDKTFYKILNGLLKRVNDSSKLTINKEQAVRMLTTLTTQSKQAVDIAK